MDVYGIEFLSDTVEAELITAAFFTTTGHKGRRLGLDDFGGEKGTVVTTVHLSKIAELNYNVGSLK